MNKFSYYLTAFSALMILVSCTGEYDPFLDPSNARAFAKKTGFADKGSITIFSTETLEVAVSARDMVDSFKISAHNNRFFHDSVIYNNGPVPMGPYYTFFVSMVDTGWDSINLTTYKKNGDISFPVLYRVYCASPLCQDTVEGNYGKPFKLATKPVGDDDVRYHWDFNGLGKTFISTDSITSATIQSSGLVDSIGTLYVTDKNGNNKSPVVHFLYRLVDTTGPLIMCINENYEGKDTIKTSDSTFLFKVQIVDLYQSSPVCSARVNDDKFDRVSIDKYIKIIPKMDTVKSLLRLHVRAMDNLRSRNCTEKEFFVKFSDTVAHASKSFITVLNPKLDSSNRAQASVTPRSIFGSIEDLSEDSLNLRVDLWVNGKKQAAPFFTKGQSRVYWSFDADLVKGIDSIKIIALKSPFVQADSVASVKFTLSYDPAVIIADSVPPKILDVSATSLDGKIVTDGFSANDTAVVRVIAVDEATYVDTLKINNSAIKSGQTGIQYIWFDTVKIKHRAQGDTIRVDAIDKSNNKTSYSIVVMYNRLPQITREPSPQEQLIVNKNYLDVISAVDPDGDVVSFSKKSGPAGLMVSTGGIISWTPQAADSGTKDILIRVSDGIGDTVYSYSFVVVNSFDNTPPIRFEPGLITFPSYLQAGRDSVFTTFPIKAGTGKPPFSFVVKNVSATMKDSVFKWKPVMADTGVHKPVIIVTDQLATSDTLFLPSILVVPPNRPFSLKVTYALTLLPDSSLDMRNRASQDTLTFSIQDPDTFIADNHTVSITQSRVQTVYSLDSSRTFLVILDPAKVNKSTPGGLRDTIAVKVSDQGGVTRSMRVYVLYADPKVIATNKKISFNTTAQNNGAGISTNVENFPLLVRLDTSNFDFTLVNKFGQNIYFQQPNGSFLPFEIEQWDSARGVASIWVRLDTVFGNSNSQFITLAWGDLGASQHSLGSDVFKASNGFAGVWHFSEG